MKGPPLSTLRPQLAKEWHKTKNGSLKPSEVQPYSPIKVWWRCSKVKKHTWQSAIKNRTKGSKCPFCWGNKVSPEFTLLSKFPVIAKEWHPTLNGSIAPSSLRPHSNKYAWWKCNRNSKHIWKAKIQNRTSLGRGCPKCGSQTSKIEIRVFTEIKSIFSDAKHRVKFGGREADIFIPSLKLAIEIDGGYWHKEKNSKDLSKDDHFKQFGIKLVRLRSNKLTQTPNSVLFDDRKGISKANIDMMLKTVLKICKCSVVVRQKISRYQKNISFKHTTEYNKIVHSLATPLNGKSLSDLFPKISLEWHPIKNGETTPSGFLPKSNEYAWWKCKNGHEWKAVISSRTAGNNCQYCSGRRASKGNNIVDSGPKVARQWNYRKNVGLNPRHLTTQSNKKVWWICSKGHEWKTTVASRTAGTKCPTCQGRVLTPEKSLMQKFPAIAREWDATKNETLSPKTVFHKSSKSVWWICSKNSSHSWKTAIKNRTKGKTKCPFCASKRASKERNLLIENPILTKEWDKEKNGALLPSDVLPYSGKKAWWICRKGHSYSATINDRNSGGNGCPYCAGQRASPNYNLKILHPRLMQEWHPTKNGSLKPETLLPGTHRKVWWKCRSNSLHTWEAMISNRTKKVRPRGCPYCSGHKKLA